MCVEVVITKRIIHTIKLSLPTHNQTFTLRKLILTASDSVQHNQRIVNIIRKIML